MNKHTRTGNQVKSDVCSLMFTVTKAILGRLSSPPHRLDSIFPMAFPDGRAAGRQASCRLKYYTDCICTDSLRTRWENCSENHACCTVRP